MARPRLEEKKKVMYRVFVPQSYVEILDKVIENLNAAGVADQIQVPVPKKEPQPIIQTETVEKKQYGVSYEDWLKKQGREVVPVFEKEEEQKDYTAWQSDPLLRDIYNSCMWEPTGENQCYPEGVEKYQIKYKDLWAKLFNAKKNNKTALCDEIMTEIKERIENE